MAPDGAAERPERPAFARWEAELRQDGLWVDASGTPLPVSASDLERHAYCPMSWYLERAGVHAEGSAVERGREIHEEIHRAVTEMKQHELNYRREILIWSWWFTILVAFCLDAVAFFFADEQLLRAEWMVRISRYLVMLAIVWLALVLLMLILPWRRLLGWERGAREALEDQFGSFREDPLPSQFEGEGFRGGWVRAGRVEAWLGLGVITIGMHSLAIRWARDRNLATFLLLVVAALWTIAASFQLRRALRAWQLVEGARDDVGFSEVGDVMYSDDEQTAQLLQDEHTGLRGRPDQVMVVDGGYVPVEQKTGRPPPEPHLSHRRQVLAYLRLVDVTTSARPPYGVLRYADRLFTVPWDESAELELMGAVATVQGLMVSGDAHRDHMRPGKCRNCSRLMSCPERLVEPHITLGVPQADADEVSGGSDGVGEDASAVGAASQGSTQASNEAA